MKKFRKYISLLLLVFVVCGGGKMSAKAASNVPANVKALKVKNISEKKATLYWSAAKRATGYYIYKLDASGLPKKIGSTKSKNYELKGLKLGETYQYRVKAYRKVKKKVYLSTGYSNIVTVTTRVVPPEVPTSFSAVAKNDHAVYVSWIGDQDADGYEVASYKGGEYTLVKTAKNPDSKKNPEVSVTVNNLETGTKYSYAVRSYKTVNGEPIYSKYTDVESATPSELASEISEVRSFRYKGKTKSAVTVYNYDTGKSQTVKKNTVVTSSSKRGTYLVAYLPNGDKIKIKRSALNIPTGVEYNSKSDYSKAVKEGFVNSKGSYLASATNYLIWISHYRTRVNIFKGSAGKWKLIRTFKVAIGRQGSVRGKRSICRKIRWGYDGLPSIHWSPQGNAFHSLMGASVGNAVSQGCIRCKSEDLWYMYNNIPLYTRVYSY